MTVTREMMKGWGWSEESIEWYLEDQAILGDLPLEHKGYYMGVFDAFAYENGAHDNGLSRHRLPRNTMMNDDEGRGIDFDYRTFLAVMGDIDDEGHIFLPGCTHVAGPYGGDVVFALHCTESVQHSEPEELSDVTWGYRESLAVWKEVFAS